MSDGKQGPNKTVNRSRETNPAEKGYPGYDDLPDPLAVDASNPLVFLNDQTTDNYMGEFALALADSGRTDLKGFLLGYPREVWRNKQKYRKHRQRWIANHRKMHTKAVESGMKKLPQPQLGVFDHHKKPSSGVIEETKPIGSVGTDIIVKEARNATPDKPLVVAVGGDICTVADAYLTDPSIADSLVVYWHEQVGDINDQSGYNIQNSGWSAYVALSRLSFALDHNSGGFTITSSEVKEQVPSPLDEYMMTKEHYKWGNPLRSTEWSEKGEWQADDEKALSLANFPNTREATRSLSVSGLQSADWNYEPKMIAPKLSVDNTNSKMIQITEIGESDHPFWSVWE